MASDQGEVSPRSYPKAGAFQRGLCATGWPRGFLSLVIAVCISREANEAVLSLEMQNVPICQGNVRVGQAGNISACPGPVRDGVQHSK